MAQVKTVTDWMTERGLDVAALVAASALDRRVVEASVHSRYPPSPPHRRRLRPDARPDRLGPQDPHPAHLRPRAGVTGAVITRSAAMRRKQILLFTALALVFAGGGVLVVLFWLIPFLGKERASTDLA